jgi:predicted RNA-binding protein YlqC (UPF0109 family)
VEALLEFLARALVDEPEAVEITSFEEDDGTVVFEVSVSDEDAGKLIGRGGRTINAVRAIIRAAATRDGRRALVDVVEPG